MGSHHDIPNVFFLHIVDVAVWVCKLVDHFPMEMRQVIAIHFVLTCPISLGGWLTHFILKCSAGSQPLDRVLLLLRWAGTQRALTHLQGISPGWFSVCWGKDVQTVTQQVSIFQSTTHISPGVQSHISFFPNFQNKIPKFKIVFKRSNHFIFVQHLQFICSYHSIVHTSCAVSSYPHIVLSFVGGGCFDNIRPHLD